MSRRTLFVFSVIALLLVFAGGVLLYKSDKIQRWGKLIGQNQAALASRHSPSLGNAEAKVHIVEFLDPACETCAAFYPEVKKMMAANPDRIRLSVRHLPLHNGSLEVVKMLEASRKQGKYWPTLEAVLANQSRWVSNHTARPEMVWEVLGGAGLNLEQLRTDMNSPDVARNLEQDRSDAKALDVTMTPEYFVNGRPLPDFGLAQLQALVRDALKDAYR
jgi:protein-disulfide isomerase